MNTDLTNRLSHLPYALPLAGAFLVAGLVATHFCIRAHAIVRVGLQLISFAGFSILLFGAGVIPFEQTPSTGSTFADAWIGVFKIAWWLAASWLLSGLLRAVLAFRRGAADTRFLQDIVVGAIYVCAALGVVADVFDIPVTGLLAASGVVAIVIGLALQSTLGDVFSGVVLNVSKPYRSGDWIILDGGMQGQVIETNWRATLLLTPDNDVAVVPNSLITKTKVINASEPMKAHGFTVNIRLEPSVSPARGGLALQSALLSCNRILRTPAPIVCVRSLDAAAMGYDLQFFVSSFEQGQEAQNELIDLVFRHCASAGIRLAAPSGSLASLTPPARAPSLEDMPRRLLDHLAIFAPLSEDERIALVPKMKRRTHGIGATVVKQGHVAGALSIIGAGVLSAVQENGAVEEEALRLAPGDSFGEAGVLAGEASMFKIKALTNVTVYEIAKADLAPIIKQRPALAAALGEVLASRQAVGKARLEDFADRNKPDEDFASRVSQRVKELFGVA
jgi:small-conductance mechanosensitive channel/CRP-like cAMP-binding protein